MQTAQEILSHVWSLDYASATGTLPGYKNNVDL